MTKTVFEKHSPFYQTLKGRIETHFRTHNLAKTGNAALRLKAMILCGAALLNYAVLLMLSVPVVVQLLLCALLGLILAGIGFAIMHDACHYSFSSSKKVNDLVVLSLNALGGNAFLFRQKHQLHHSYTNIDGLDDDIAKSPLLRQCDVQVWKPMHRYQHWYVLLLYPFSGIFWITVFDFTKYFKGQISGMPLRRMDRTEHLLFWVSKLFYFFVYVGLPIYLLGVNQWLVGYLVMNMVMGLTLALVFQLGHVVEHTQFYQAKEEGGMLPVHWAEHEVQASANFAISNKLVTWYTGGLNYQIEHHLFPRISHVHYPAISKLVQQTCHEYGLPYFSYPSFTSAVRSHFRLLRTLGNTPPVASPKTALARA